MTLRKMWILFSASLATLVMASACLDSRVGITEPRQHHGVVIVSRTVPTSGLGASRASASARVGLAGDSVVYVSLVPGTVPGGTSIAILNRSRGQSLSVAIVAGGLDPVAIPAQTGDTLEFVVTDSAGGTRSLGSSTVAVHPPVIVRTVPPPGGTDVSLNAQLIVVFSEPMDPRTVTTQTMQVQQNGQPVAGGVTLSSDGLTAAFQPAVPLAPLTAYTLGVSTSVADIGGAQLSSAVLVAFHTGGVVADLLPSVSAGMTHTCAVTTAGDAYCWGQNESGQLGIGFRSPYVASPTRVSGGLRFGYVGAGGSFTCGLTSAGAAYCWGTDSSGVLGIGARDTVGSSVPVPVSGGLTFTSLSVGPDHVCGMAANGQGFCWGNGDLGQLGTNMMQLSGRVPELVEPLASGGPTTLSATGFLHTCGIDSSGHAYCWGGLLYQVAALGNFVFIDQWTQYPTAIHGGLIFQSVKTGFFHTCGITANGAAYCWGTNSGGELGVGATTGGDPEPTPVAGGLKFQQIASGQGEYTCGVVVGGAAYCWGVNDNGELGSSADSAGCPIAPSADSLIYYAAVTPGQRIPCSTTPVRAADPLTFASLTTGTTHTCGVTLGGELYCWGGNAFGQLGNGSTTQSSTPILVPLQLVTSSSP